MYRDEEVRLVEIGESRPFSQGDKHVAVPGEQDVNVLLFEGFLHPDAQVQDQVFLDGPFLAQRSGVLASVAGVQDYQGLPRFFGGVCLPYGRKFLRGRGRGGSLFGRLLSFSLDHQYQPLGVLQAYSFETLEPLVEGDHDLSSSLLHGDRGGDAFSEVLRGHLGLASRQPDPDLSFFLFRFGERRH